MALHVMEVCMVAFRDYLSTFIVNSDLVDCLLCVLVVLLSFFYVLSRCFSR